MGKRVKLLFTSVILLVFAVIVYDNTRGCDLCREKSCHAPCLVNLASGECAELVVYDERFGELYGKTEEGVYYYLKRAGAETFLDTINENNTAYLDLHEAVINPFTFCGKCRKRLYAFREDGFVLANCYEGEPLTLYPIIESAEYKIRDYTVSIGRDDYSGKTEIIVAGKTNQ